MAVDNVLTRTKQSKMQASSTDQLFTTDSSYELSTKREQAQSKLKGKGRPLKLTSRPVQLLVTDQEDECWVAETGYISRLISLKTNKTSRLLKGHQGPVTAIGQYKQLVLTASWDQSIRVYSTTNELLSSTIAHQDFVKSLLVVEPLSIVVTGGSDKMIRIHDLAAVPSLQPQSEQSTSTDLSGPNTEQRHQKAAPFQSLSQLAVIRGSHQRPVTHLATLPAAEANTQLVLSGDSMGQVNVWHVTRTEDKVETKLLAGSRVHEGAVNDLKVVMRGPPEEDSEDLEPIIEIWTAGSDNTLLLSFLTISEGYSLVPILRVTAPASVRSVLPVTSLLSQRSKIPPPDDGEYVVLGGADDTLRIVDLSSLLPPSGDPDRRALAFKPAPVEKKYTIGTKTSSALQDDDDDAPAVLRGTIRAHAHEVTSLALVFGSEGPRVLSASLDSTLRRWSWPADLLDAASTTDEPVAEDKEEPNVAAEVEAAHDEIKKESLLTEEEERELAELMGDD